MLVDNTWEDIKDVITPGIVSASWEAANVRVADWMQQGYADQNNISSDSLQDDLDDLMRMADADGDQVITGEELYKLVSGSALPPQLRKAFSQPLLFTTSTARNSWDLFVSRLASPVLKRITQVNADIRFSISDQMGYISSTLNGNIQNITEGVFLKDFLTADIHDRATDKLACIKSSLLLDDSVDEQSRLKNLEHIPPTHLQRNISTRFEEEEQVLEKGSEVGSVKGRSMFRWFSRAFRRQKSRESATNVTDSS